jgi:hypothetical protein
MVRCLEHVTFDSSMPTTSFESRSVTRELPNHYSFIVQRGYIIGSVSQWERPAKTLFDFTVETLKGIASRVVDGHVESYARSGLKRRVS